MSETELVLWKRLVTHRAALLCTFSIWLTCDFAYGSQTLDEYSSLGRTEALYACSFTFESLFLDFFSGSQVIDKHFV